MKKKIEAIIIFRENKKLGKNYHVIILHDYNINRLVGESVASRVSVIMACKIANTLSSHFVCTVLCLTYCVCVCTSCLSA